MSLAWNLVRSLFGLGKRRILGRRSHPSWDFSRKLASQLFRNNMKRVVKMGFEEQRAFYQNLARPNPFPSQVLESWLEIEGLRACWFTPTRTSSNGTLLYWHGGATVSAPSIRTRSLLLELRKRAAVAPSPLIIVLRQNIHFLVLSKTPKK